jgi:hypothetical protein
MFASWAGQVKPTEQGLVRSLVLPTARQDPAVHAVQVPAPSALKNPAGHAAAAVDIARQKLPAGHVVQPESAAAPVVALNVPAGHAVGATVAAEGQKKPSGHAVQAPRLENEIPPADQVPAGHAFWVPDACPATQ